MKTIKESARSHKLIVKKSIFICTIYHISSRKDAEEKIQEINDEFDNSSHNAFAYRIGDPVSWEDSSDDGELRGCAAKPLMDILKRKTMTDVIVFVSRFYGGVNLGFGRLKRSYAQSANNLIELVGLIDSKENS